MIIQEILGLLPAFQDPITKTTSNLGFKTIKTSEIRIYFEKIEAW